MFNLSLKFHIKTDLLSAVYLETKLTQ